MIVKESFFCTIEKKTYKKGSEYKGNRKDINHLLEEIKEDKRKKVNLETK